LYRPKRKFLSKREVNYWVSRIYRLLESGDCQVLFKDKIVIDKERCWGLFLPGQGKNGEDVILISAEKGNDLINTLIHEALHCLEPDFPEKMVRWLTQQICKKLSAVQYVRILILLGRNLDSHYKVHPLPKK